jgi:hypothetical protein
MRNVGVMRLIEDLQAAFLLPGIILVIVLINIGRTRDRWAREDSLRVMLRFILALFLVLLTTLLYQDRSVPLALWNADLAGYSFVYVGGCALVIVGVALVVHWKLRPQLWRDGSGTSD